MKDETIIGLRATKAKVHDFGGVQKCTNYPGHDKGCQKSNHLYTEHLRQEAAKKSTKEAKKRQKQKLKRENLKKRSQRESSR